MDGKGAIGPQQVNRFSATRSGSAGGVIAAAIVMFALIASGPIGAARPVSAAIAAPNDPIEEARGFVDQAIAILKNPNLTLTQERRELRALAEPHFDFEGMSKSALGYHWRDLNPEQRQQFTTLFTAFMEDIALGRVQDYSGQQLEFTREIPMGPGQVQVLGHVVRSGGQPINVSFMSHQVDGLWKVYDITVENISVIANYRNQFNRVINNQGFPQLMALLQQKQAELAALLGRKNDSESASKAD